MHGNMMYCTQHSLVCSNFADILHWHQVCYEFMVWVVDMQAHVGSHREASHLAAQVSQLSAQLHAAQAAAAAAQQEVHHLQSKHQVCTTQKYTPGVCAMHSCCFHMLSMCDCLMPALCCI